MSPTSWGKRDLQFIHNCDKLEINQSVMLMRLMLSNTVAVHDWLLFSLSRFCRLFLIPSWQRRQW